MGRHLCRAGQPAPVGDRAVGRARRNRPSAVRAGVRRSRASRGDGGLMSKYGRPTAIELAAAIEDFLRREAVPALEGRLAFQALVAANAAAILQRELAAGPDAEAAHQRRLLTLGAADDAALAA